MRFSIPTFAAALVLAAAASAQSFTIEGDIDSVQGTNRFVLDCTNINLISNTVNLQALHDASRQQDIEYRMDVMMVGPNTLNVLSAVAFPEQLDMGNLRFGRSERWAITGAPGSAFAIFVNTRAATSLLPVPPLGAWVVGGNAPLFTQGQIGGFGRFEFSYTMPTIPALVGVEFTTQAALVSPANVLSITHAACKDVRSN